MHPLSVYLALSPSVASPSAGRPPPLHLQTIKAWFKGFPKLGRRWWWWGRSQQEGRKARPGCASGQGGNEGTFAVGECELLLDSIWSPISDRQLPRCVYKLAGVPPFEIDLDLEPHQLLSCQPRTWT
ncbi:hypothetical protein K456DRAFT_658835 [Colletotrichum gloeosporioides 23]|nr:hypothetical protein K456DRAFT_658835 [Colletotrichum gloeosporioides 23]